MVLAQEGEGHLRCGVGLRQHGYRGLLHDGVPRQVGGLVGDVHVADPTLGGRHVLANVQDRSQGVGQAVLIRTQLTATGVDQVDGGVEGSQS